VAVDGETIAGCSGALIADGYPFTVHGIKRGYIFGVRVAPAYRKRGIVARLTERAIAFLRSKGAKLLPGVRAIIGEHAFV
jgi:ribosomal protein S18 acetylase RimI-like enzyme